MYVINETFDGWYVPKTYHDYARWFDAEWKNDLTAMVRASYNHPYVILYSHGNEVSETATDKGARKALLEALKKGGLDRDALDRSAARVLELVFQSKTAEGF